MTVGRWLRWTGLFSTAGRPTVVGWIYPLKDPEHRLFLGDKTQCER